MNYKKLLISIAVCLLVGFLGSIATSTSVTSWYPTLVKPSFTPPNSVFAPVWTVLYILIGLSAYFIWNQKNDNRKKKDALMVFIAQLFVNFLWSFVFFGLRSAIGGLFVIVLLWGMILYLIRLFCPLHKLAAYLLVPYFLWVTFATALNAGIWMLNK